MGIETDLSVAPYFDDTAHGLASGYYKVLFKPSVPVQVRELNELQSILQNQIEEFGDNILKRGTIVRGCSFAFFNAYPYIQIKDVQVDTAPVSTESLRNTYLVNSSTGLRAYVQDVIDGFEQTDDKKTLYVKYLNSGASGASLSFSGGDVLTVQDPNYGVQGVTIAAGGSGYSNSDSVVFVPAIAVTNVVGTLSVGDTITQTTTGANSVVVSIDTSTYTDKTIIKVRPTTTDLANTQANSSVWTFSVGEDNIIQKSTNSAVNMIPVEIIGSGATATLTTDSAQKVIDVAVLDPGQGYYVSPYATVKPTAGGTGVSLTAENYFSQITVINAANSVGLGYAFGVSEGVIYQKGHFVKVDPQTVVVEKYSQFPNNVSVGFETQEDLINAFVDTKLLDNALGSPNYTAPGADRLKLTPVLKVLDTDTAKANADFFSLVEFAEGVPYKQNQRTSYNKINDEMAIRTVEQSGDYVIDPFLVAMKSTGNSSLLANTFDIAVDPGRAYIDGYRIETKGTYQIATTKGIDTQYTNNAVVSLDYGSYVVVEELGGSFDFSAGATVDLYDAPKNWLSNNATYAAGTITASGTKIGTARIRSLVLADSNPFGTPSGAPATQYRLYMFDVQLTAGKSFSQVRSVYYDGATYKGIADIVLDSNGDAVLLNTVASNGASLDRMLFYSGFDSPLAINTVSYNYRQFEDDGTYTISNSSVIAINLAGNESFPYGSGADLSTTERADLYMYPLETLTAYSNATGTVAVTSSSNVVVGTTTSFTTDFKAGDYVYYGNSSSNAIRRIAFITNATSMQLDYNAGVTNSASGIYRAFPKYVPFPIVSRTDIVANTTGTQTLTVDMGVDLDFSGTKDIGAAFTVKVSNSAVDVRTPLRNTYVKLCLANNNTGFGYSGYGTSQSVTLYGNTTTANVEITGTNLTSYFANGDNIVVTVGGVQITKTLNKVANATFMNVTSGFTVSGSASVKSAVNSDGPWCLGVPDIFRLRAVYLGNSSVNSTAFPDVTRNFYIDHNQNPNYQGLGYLVKDKNSKFVLKNTDYLLVQFDSFAQTNEGRPVHINSYVSANSTTRYTNDSANLATLTAGSAVNTLEIPEVHAPTGTDYDLISHIDFRPRVVATANSSVVTDTDANMTINPSDTATFTTAAKKFPVPDSQVSFNVENFLGRIDSVYVDSAGKIGVNKGFPTSAFRLFSSNVDDLVAPVKNQKVMVLNNVRIPPYPSIEQNRGTTLSTILNKRMLNEKLLNRRLNDRTITRLFTQQEIELSQPKAYSMEAIGNLERRIKDLEYYVALSALELQIKDLNIPSSVDPNINRFKFGFFTDPYNDDTFSLKDDQEYRARIEKGRVVPQYENIKITYPQPEQPYSDYSVVSQLKATGNELAICVANAAIERTQPQNKADDTYYITMANNLANTSGLVNIYAYFYSGADEIFVYQSTVANSFSATPIYNANNSVALTNNDVTYLRTLPFFKDIKDNDLKKHSVSGGKLKYGGKISFNHNPAAGRYYKVYVKNDSKVWRYRMEYPVNVSCLGSDGGGESGRPEYSGTMIYAKGTKYGGLNLDKDVTKKEVLTRPDGGVDTYEVEYKPFHMIAFGLKPSTLHKVYFNKKDVTNLVDTTVNTPWAPTLASTLATWNIYGNKQFDTAAQPTYVMSDTNGKLDMLIYMVEDAEVNGKDVIKEVEVKNPLIEVKSADGGSYAAAVVEKSFKLFVER